MKFRQARKRSLWGRKVNTVYKTWRGTPSELRKLRKPKLRLDSSDSCCSEWIGWYSLTHEQQQNTNYSIKKLKQREIGVLLTFVFSELF